MKIGASMSVQQAENLFGQIQRMIAKQFSAAVAEKKAAQMKAEKSFQRILRMHPNELMSMKEAASIFGVSLEKLQSEVKASKITYVDHKGNISNPLVCGCEECKVSIPISLPQRALMSLMVILKTDEGLEIINQAEETYMAEMANT
ncbi:MAG TPA: hypothetical protein VE954_05800 [Oligoflexus sp.]|uniref:hypothetical protein n=1 Tax=Oligoflexus sp. TaxID=1971216 RepID=UPI002D3BC38C|nr:hypothetical protein [Oligoflexus sp.]HYX32606.1 hypothetical protein [Oligoflexus sp.]